VLREGLKLLVIVFVASLIGFDAQSQATLVLEERRALKFGEWAADDTLTGSVTVPPSSDVANGTGTLISFGGQVRRARFRITGEPRAYVIVSLPSSITIRKGSSSHTMVIDSFTMDQTNPIRLNKNGRKIINVGATLRVGANQRQGKYDDSNSFTVFVDYQ